MKKTPLRFEFLSAALFAALSTIVTQPIRAQFLPGEVNSLVASFFTFIVIAAGYLFVLIPYIRVKNKDIKLTDFILASFVMFAGGMAMFFFLRFIGFMANIEVVLAAQFFLYTFLISSMLVWLFGKIT